MSFRNLVCIIGISVFLSAAGVAQAVTAEKGNVCGKGGVCSVAPKAGSSDDYYDKGVALGSQGKFKESIPMFKKAAEIDPNNAEAYNAWGISLVNTGKVDEALDKYKKAASIDPKMVKTYYNWGNALNSVKRYDEAIAKYKKATELDPKFSYAFNGWGLALASQGHFDEAIAKLKKVVALDPSNAADTNKIIERLQDMKAMHGKNPVTRKKK